MMKKIAGFPAKSLIGGLLGGAFLLAGTGAVRAEDATAVKAPSPWTTSAAAGLTLTRGNSKTLLATANLGSERKTADDQVLLGADATYGETSGVKNSESLHGFGQYNRQATTDFYYGLRLDALHDAIADVNYRLTLAPLVGYYLIKQTNTTLTVEAGPAFVYHEQGHITKGYATLRLGERFEHKFTATTRLWQTFEILPQVDKFDNYYINAEIGVESALTKHVSMRTYLQDTYYNIPAAGREKNDIKLVAAIAYKF